MDKHIFKYWVISIAVTISFYFLNSPARKACAIIFWCFIGITFYVESFRLNEYLKKNYPQEHKKLEDRWLFEVTAFMPPEHDGHLEIMQKRMRQFCRSIPFWMLIATIMLFWL